MCMQANVPLCTARRPRHIQCAGVASNRTNSTPLLHVLARVCVTDISSPASSPRATLPIQSRADCFTAGRGAAQLLPCSGRPN